MESTDITVKIIQLKFYNNWKKTYIWNPIFSRQITHLLRKKVRQWNLNGPESLFAQPGSGRVGTNRVLSGCISSQASEGVCHCATICTHFSGRLNPLTPQFLIKITLGVISQKSWGWRSEGWREGWVSGGRFWIDGEEREFDPKPVISIARSVKMSLLRCLVSLWWSLNRW